MPEQNKCTCAVFFSDQLVLTLLLPAIIRLASGAAGCALEA